MFARRFVITRSDLALKLLLPFSTMLWMWSVSNVSCFTGHIRTPVGGYDLFHGQNGVRQLKLRVLVFNKMSSDWIQSLKDR